MARHKHHNTSRWFFILLAIFIGVLSWRLVEPFAIVLLTAAVAAIVAAPFDTLVREQVKRPRLAAIITVLATFLLVLIPLFIIGVLIVRQAGDVVQTFDSSVLQTFNIESIPFFEVLPDIAKERLLQQDVSKLGRAAANWVFSRSSGIFSGTANFLFSVFFFFIALYYFLSDRDKIHKELLALSPFKDKLDDDIIKRLTFTVRTVVFGALTVAVIQGILAAIGMTVFGVPGSLLWGSLVIIAAQVPLLGVGLIMIPAVIYLFAIGNLTGAIGLAIWSAVAVGLVDNLLSPYLLEGRTKMHAFLILISILGGLQLFGPIGLIIGPTILAALMVLIDIYKTGILEKK